MDILSEPVPAVGTGAGSSPFDSYAPWNGMEEYNVISNALSHKKGESGFSRTANDTVVKIPEFYCKFALTGGKLYIYVADGPATGFIKHPGSGNAPGRYNTIAGYYSKSGAAPLVNITRAAARTGSKNKGSKWSQHDYATWCAVWLLYLVEFADWDSQAMIGKGVTNEGTTAQAVGGTDSMTYHTGRAAGTDGATQVQYRWIENPWGNVWEWIDGANFNNQAAYICTNYANYADDTTTNYAAAGVTLGGSSGQYITILGPNKKLLHKARKLIAEFMHKKLGLRMKRNWQVYPTAKRMVSAVGYRFARTHIIMRKRNFLRLTRQCRRVKKRLDAGLPIALSQATGLLSRIGFLHHCNSHKARVKYVDPIGIKHLKEVVRYESKRRSRAQCIHAGGAA